MLLILIGIGLGILAFRMKTSKSMLALFIGGAVFATAGLVSLAPSQQTVATTAPGASTAASSNGSDSSSAAPTPNRRAVSYRLVTSCPSGADLTFFNENGDITQYTGRRGGWEYTFEPRRGDFLSISAQNQCDSGRVTVQLVHRGEVIAENTSIGGYVIASVDRVW